MEVEEQGETTGVKAPSVAAGAEGNDNRRDAGSGGGVVGEGSGESQTVFRETAQVSDAVTGTPGAESVRGGSGDREEGGQSGRSEEEKKLWATVSSNPSDFKSWTTLLQLAEQNSVLSVLSVARETFSQFLRFYPFCYGYWKKYAELVRRLVSGEAAREVLEEGVAAIPLSVDLWLHYASFATAHYKDSPKAEQLIRSVYDRAVDSCGLDYRSTGIWEAYIGWESGGGRQERVTALYDRLLATPTKDLATHFDNFKKLLETTPTSQMLSEEEYRDMTSQAGDVTQGEAMLDGYVRKVTLEQRTAVFERTMAELEKRKHFELMIKRPYFHVKPLERLQLKNWRDYLDFEISQGDPRRIEFLFERCVVSCALYEDFWSKYCKYAETHIREWASAIYRRACNIHLQQKPNIHVAWAAFEEKNGNVDTAREILTSVDRAVPGQVAVRVRRIGLEIRAGRYSEANALYQETLSSTMALETRNFYAWRYARFTDKLMRDHGKAVSVMTTAVDMDPSNTTLYLQLLDLHTSGPAPPDMPAAEALFAKVASSPHLSEEAKDSFLTRRQQLLEEFGGNFSDLLEVTEMCEKIARKTRKRLASEADGGPAKKTTGDQPQLVTMPTSHPMGMVQPLTPDQQQWAAYQQQWAGYNYAQPQQGQLYQGYYPPYPYSQASATT